VWSKLSPGNWRSAGQPYRLIARYMQTRNVEGLRGPGSGRPEGTRVINSDEETLIREILERACLKPTGLPFQHVLEQIGV
jgi:hypothetical protein